MKFIFLDDPFIKKDFRDQIKAIPGIDEYIEYNKPIVDADDLVERAQDAELISADIYTQFTPEIIDRLPNLKAFFVQAVGYNQIDVAYAHSKGIKVFNCAGFNANAVAEYVFSLIVTLYRKIPAAQEHVRVGGWDYRLFSGKELRGRVIGIVGAGNVGSRIAKIAKGYDMDVLMTTAHPSEFKRAELGIRNFVDLQTLLKTSDIVVLAVPLSDETHHLIGKQELALMKPQSLLVNTSRQTIVDEFALAQSLIDENIGGAVLDVLLEEPFSVKKQDVIIQEMINLPNVIVTPHIAGVTEESMESIGAVFLENIKNYLAGSNKNLVS